MDIPSKTTSKRPRRKATEDTNPLLELSNNGLLMDTPLVLNQNDNSNKEINEINEINKRIDNNHKQPYPVSETQNYDISEIEPEKIDIDKEFENVEPLPVTNRRNIRIRTLQAIYAQLSSEYEPAMIFNHLLRNAHQELRKKFLDDPTKEDDSAFMSSLFFDVIKNKSQYESFVEEKIQNWEIKRIAQVDKILLLMGIHEFLHFEEIPLKVSINEYVEIAKIYGAEKSNHFVNGLLDAIQIALKENNMIHKKGKGLVVN